MSTRDIKEALIARIERLQHLSGDELRCQVSDIVDGLLSSRVAVTVEQSDARLSPVPEYDAATDGDYSQWLAMNNID